MSSSISQDCFINGVQYKCRTCFDPGATTFLLASECSDTKTWRDLLRDMAQLQTEDNDSLPKTVCCKCLDKLINYYDFILQIHSVNKKYEELLGSCNDPLQVQIKDEIITVEDANTDIQEIPLQQPVSEIKLEQEFIVPYDIVTVKNYERCPESVENEALHPSEDINITNVSNSDGIDDSVSLNENDDFYEFESSLLSSDEDNIDDQSEDYQYHDIKGQSIYEPQMSIIEKTAQTCNKPNNPDIGNSDPFKKIEEVNGRFDCPLCTSTFLFREKCIEHIITVHALQLSKNKDDSEKMNKVPVAIKSKKVPVTNTIKKMNDRFMCRICKETFSLKSSCIQHVSMMHQKHDQEQNPIKCDFCEKEFQCREYLQRHLRHLHLDDIRNVKKIVDCDRTVKSVIQCGLCEKSFQKLNLLHQHITIHSDGNTGINFGNCLYTKIFEGSETIDYSQLQNQIQEAFRTGDISTFYQATDKYGNELHISDSDSDMEDTIIKTYICEICNKVLGRRTLLLQHQEEFHREEFLPYRCGNCNKDFVCKDLLEQHFKRDCRNEQRHKKHQCEFCSAHFIWPNNLLKHRELQHNILTKPSVSDAIFIPDQELPMTEISLQQPSTDVLTYYCLMCPKTFFKAEDLNNHFSRHLLSPSAIKTVESIMNSTWWPNGKKKIICKTCNLKFKSMSELSEHYQNSTCEKLKNSLTNYSITNKNGFELHLELDSETETETDDNKISLYSYKCSMCYKTFKRKYQLAQHQRSRHIYELLELKCELCIFRTVSRKVLDYHKATQCFNEEKQFKCDQCNFRFMWKENMENHIAICHSSNSLAEVTFLNPQNVNLLSPDNIAMKDVVTTSAKCKSTGDENSMNNYESKNLDLPSTSSNTNVNKGTASKIRKRLSCQLCDVTCPSSSQMEMHMWTHTGEKPFKCEFCGLAFRRTDALYSHKRAFHINENPFKCNQCEKSFKDLISLKDHTRNHKEGPYTCVVCSKTFSNALSLGKHVKVMGHDKSNVLIIKDPEELINNDLPSTSSNLNMDTSKNKKKISCELCDVTCYSSCQMEIHMRTHTGEKPFKCEFCEKEFSRKSTLNGHKRALHINESPFKCNDCEKSFQDLASLKVHARDHKEKAEPFICVVCNKTLANAQSLENHIKILGHNQTNIFKHTGEARLCPICGKYVSVNSSFTLHMKRHAGEKPHKCDFCDMAFITKYHLNCHRKTHTGERPFKCTLCEKSFSLNSKLKIHFRVHTGERPYECKYCKKRFGSHNNYSVHVRMHTGEKNFKCETCGEAFTCGAYLKKHRITKHKL